MHDHHDTTIHEKARSNSYEYYYKFVSPEEANLLREQPLTDAEPVMQSKKSKMYHKWIKWVICLFIIAYTIAASILSNNRGEFAQAIPLIVIAVLYLLKRIGTTFRQPIKKACHGPWGKLQNKFSSNKMRKIFMFSMFALVMICVWIFLGVVIVGQLGETSRLIGWIGIVVIYLLGFLVSKHRKQIRLRPIIGAFCMQWIMGLIVMRTDVGFEVVKWISDTMSTFLAFVMAGSSFVFGGDMILTNPSFIPHTFQGADGADQNGFLIGPGFMETVDADGNSLGYLPSMAPANCIHYFGFMVIPTVIYVGAFTSMLYHTGLIQPLVKGLGWGFGGILGTTVPEAVSAAGNIFLGQTEAPLLIKPFLPTMSASEIHAICVGGFATVSGSIMGAYIGVGIPAGHLISSIVMSSVGSLGFAKLLWPETDPTKNGTIRKTPENKAMMARELRNTLYAGSNHTNAVEAAAAGASDMIALAANIGAMLIAFLSIIACFNSLLNWLCYMVDITRENGENVSIEYIFGMIFAPIVYTLGVTEWREALIVGNFIGLKLIATEMTAFISLGEYINNNTLCAMENAASNGCDTANILSENAVTIASYSLCGFGNFGSVGIVIGGLVAMAPQKRPTVVAVIGRALFAGLLTNLCVATIAGMLSDPTKTFM